jgi:flagellar biosynthesis protein
MNNGSDKSGAMNKKKRKHPSYGRRAAAALKYRQGADEAPRLAAKGLGRVAERIIEAAEEAGVPIHEDPDLVGLLMTLNLNDMIPPELYVAVAEVLAFVYRLNGKYKGSPGHSQSD